MKKAKDGRVIRASEIGLYTYCARAWWLGQVEGHQPVNLAALEAGQSVHQAHGQAVARYGRQRQVAYVLMGLAFLVGLVLLAVAVMR